MRSGGAARDLWQTAAAASGNNTAGGDRTTKPARSHLQGGSEGITQAVLRLRQASQGRFLRLRGCLARPNWLWMVNLRGRACWPWANGSAPLSMSCVIRAFHGERLVRRPGCSWTGLAGWTGLDWLGARVFAAAPWVEMVRTRQTKQKQTRVARRTQRRSFSCCASRLRCRLVRVGRHVAGNAFWAARVVI